MKEAKSVLYLPRLFLLDPVGYRSVLDKRAPDPEKQMRSIRLLLYNIDACSDYYIQRERMNQPENSFSAGPTLF